MNAASRVAIAVGAFFPIILAVSGALRQRPKD